MKNWKSRWKSELNKKTPQLREDVKNSKIQTLNKSESQTEAKSIQKNYFDNKKKFKAIFASCLAVILVVIAIIPIFFTSRMNAKPLASAVLVEVNPSVIFSVDKDGKVTSVVSQNSDADVILSSESRVNLMMGKQVELAIGFYIDYASRLGFIDLSKESAVKISTCEGKNGSVYLSAKASLEYYFKQKGAYVAVISNKISAEKFCEMTGIESSKTAKSVVEKLKSVSTMFSERKNDLKSVYEETVKLEGIGETIILKIEETQSEIEEKLQALEEIKNLNNQLLNHSDCPIKILTKANYWEIKLYEIEVENKEVAEIISSIDELISNYKKKYNEEIISETELELKLTTLETLKNTLSKIDIQFIEDNQDAVLETLKSYGVDTEKLLNLYEVPENIQEYKEKVNEYFNSKIEKNKSNYETSREIISNEEYEEFINKIISNNGSLDEFWNKLKSN